jgi:hypothetical protein
VVSCEEWMHSSQFQHLLFFIVITFVIVFARGGPVRVGLARGEVLPLGFPIQITLFTLHK